MSFITNLDLFSPTFDNVFVFNLFDLLLCGVIVLIILRAWQTRSRPATFRNHLFLFLTFSFLGASFVCEAVFSGAFFFFQTHLNEAALDLLAQAFRVGALLMLAASALQQPSGAGQRDSGRAFPLAGLALLAVLVLSLTWLVGGLPHAATTVFDLVNLYLLAFSLALFHRQPLGGRNLALGAVALLSAAVALHLSSFSKLDVKDSVVFWNLEQFTKSLSLFTFALAIGESSQDLFDKVFVRLQVAFILLASVMTLVVTQTEKTEYLASIRSRSAQLVRRPFRWTSVSSRRPTGTCARRLQKRVSAKNFTIA